MSANEAGEGPVALRETGVSRRHRGGNGALSPIVGDGPIATDREPTVRAGEGPMQADDAATNHRPVAAPRRRWLVIGGTVLLVVGLLAVGAQTRTGHLLTQELSSQITGKGRERALRRYRARLEAAGIHPEAARPELVICKAERRCRLLIDGRQIATFPVALGANPIGQKETLLDRRTPEGTYRICYQKEGSRYHLFIGLSYPSPDDAARALQAGRITATEAEAILDAALRQERPPWNTALGGPFGLHGYGTWDDWTEGTIALANAHIEELYWNLPPGTLVTVRP